MTRSIISATAEYESATELVATYIGEINTRRHNERSKVSPDPVKIERFSVLMLDAKRERDAMNPDNQEGTKRILKTYRSRLDNLRGVGHEPGL